MDRKSRKGSRSWKVAEGMLAKFKRDDKHSYVPPSSKRPQRIGSSPWIPGLMITMFSLGLLWIVAFYIAGPSIPVMGSLSALVNVLIGFGFITAGFVISTRWR